MAESVRRRSKSKNYYEFPTVGRLSLSFDPLKKVLSLRYFGAQKNISNKNICMYVKYKSAQVASRYFIIVSLSQQLFENLYSKKIWFILAKIYFE